jgi:RNA polymerase sigma factor (sigma-70 family)
MPASQMSEVVQHLRRAGLLRDAAQWTDGRLLESFVSRRDEAALEALVRRHGPMVWGVCRRVLGDHHDAEDAFQATFLVLVRRAASIRTNCGSWLYGVAHRTALKARATRAKRRARERSAIEMPEPAVTEQDRWCDLQALLDQELSRLPEKYRTVIVLCDLEGKTGREAVRQLGCPEGTVASRLARGRRMLAKRLARRGLAVSGGALAGALSQKATAACVPASVLSSTIKAATRVAAGQAAASGPISVRVAALTEGVMKAMSFNMLRAVVAGLGIIGAALLGAWLIWSRPAQPVPQPAPVASSPVLLEGRWRCVGEETNGRAELKWLVGAQRLTLTVTGNTLCLSAPKTFEMSGSFALLATPANAIDIHVKSPRGEPLTIAGLYVREGDRLRLCLALFSNSDQTRPTGLKTRPGDGYTTFELEKITPGAVGPETAAEQLGAILTEAQTEKLTAADCERLASRCLKLADGHPGTDEAVVSLLWALANAPDGPAGKTALALLKSGLLAQADLPTLAQCFGVNRGVIGPGHMPEKAQQELAPLLLERVRRSPDHPRAAEVLSSVCVASEGDEGPEAPPVFDEAARMIAERWVKSPDISHFLEALSYCRQRPWAGRYEPVVRSILAQSPDSYIRYRAAFTLAQLVAESGEARQEEARALYVRFVTDYKPGTVDQSVAHLVEGLVGQARREIDGLLIRGVGGAAPALKGVDLEGQPMELSDYRGKVVLLSFWASWCGSCLKLIPHERALLERFQGRPFAIVGVNGDEIDKFDRELLTTHAITWRSFQNVRPNQKSIGREWNLTAWPELYLIDHTGKIRRHWIGAPPPDELDHEVARWVAAAEGKPLPPAFRPGQAAVPPKAIKGPPARFVSRVYRDRQGGEWAYTICLPEGHDGQAPLPVVLFLHGSGQVGTDNKKQLDIGLAPAIRNNGMPFPFIGVFPQADRSSWLSDSESGRRALAILEEVEREHATDRRRVYLTGVSMGGEGVWSLATAHPTRFAAIVPVCGGGDPNRAAALKNTPCWAFHGDADDVVPVRATRDMVQALTEAGGRPQYQEYRGVGHNCWDRAYGEAELYRWLQDQARREGDGLPSSR